MTQSPSLPELPKPYTTAKELVGIGERDFFIADQMNAHYLKGYEAGSAAAAQAVPERLKRADEVIRIAAEVILPQQCAPRWTEDGAMLRVAAIKAINGYLAAPTQGAEGAAPQAVDDERRCQELRERGWQVLKCPACGCDGAVGYPRAAPQEADALREAAQVAIDVLDHYLHGGSEFRKPAVRAINALSAALATQPLAAPVQQEAEAVTAPQVGETWHILRPGAWACARVKIHAISKLTVTFESTTYGVPNEVIPLNFGLRFVERIDATPPAHPVLAPVVREPLTEAQINRIVSASEVYQYHPGGLIQFVRDIEAELGIQATTRKQS